MTVCDSSGSGAEFVDHNIAKMRELKHSPPMDQLEVGRSPPGLNANLMPRLRWNAFVGGIFRVNFLALSRHVSPPSELDDGDDGDGVGDHCDRTLNSNNKTLTTTDKHRTL